MKSLLLQVDVTIVQTLYYLMKCPVGAELDRKNVLSVDFGIDYLVDREGFLYSRPTHILAL